MTKRTDGRALNGGARPGAGRPAVKAEIREGDGVMLTHVTPNGVADLGHGRATVEAHGRSRLIKIPQPDGSEIRILIPR